MTNTNRKTAAASKESIKDKVAETRAKVTKAIPYTNDQWDLIVETDKLTSVSSQIRYLADAGFSTPENKYGMIARFLDKRIQHVRNVLTQPLKKA